VVKVLISKEVSYIKSKGKYAGRRPAVRKTKKERGRDLRQAFAIVLRRYGGAG
jgi:hypothetical protein